MIRISVISRDPENVVLRLEGSLVREAVELLEQEGRRWLDRGCRLVLDLDGVGFIDQAGRELLAGWTRRLSGLRGGSPFVRAAVRRGGLEVRPDPPHEGGPAER